MTLSPVYKPPRDPLHILHEDQHVIVLVKPAGLLSVPGRGLEMADCLLSRLQAVFSTTLLVHRLDRDTSGVMVFAQSSHAQRLLSMQFEKRQVKKTYVARVAGRLTPEIGCVDLPLIVDWPNRPRQMVCRATGKPALTEWRVMNYALSKGVEETRVRLYPKTGRSHQLRVHMLALGHVILGDPIYAFGVASTYSRLMLHSEELQFNHPESGQGVKFCAKPMF